MKTAREMFEELGFIIVHDDRTETWYRASFLSIIFFKKSKCVDLLDELNRYELDTPLIKAINKQCEEFGWFEDE